MSTWCRSHRRWHSPHVLAHERLGTCPRRPFPCPDPAGVAAALKSGVREPASYQERAVRRVVRLSRRVSRAWRARPEPVLAAATVQAVRQGRSWWRRRKTG